MSQDTLRKTDVQSITLTIPANDETVRNITGQFLRCLEANGTFKIAIDESRKEFEFDLGLEFRTLNDENFTAIRFKNESADDITATFLFGSANINDSRLNVITSRITSRIDFQEAPTELVGSAVSSIAPAGVQTFSGAPTATQVRRAAIIVTNEDASPLNYLTITDSSDNVLARVFGTQNFLLKTSDEVKVKNLTGSAISCSIGEIFYTR